MREIEFRAWDIAQKKYKYPKLWDNTMPSNWEKHYILEQYTGKIDTSRNRKVFEGDIYFEEIEGDNGDTRNYCVVVWINEVSRFALLNDYEYFDYKTMKFYDFISSHFWHEDPSLPNLEEYHYAGNINQNKELLQ